LNQAITINILYWFSSILTVAVMTPSWIAEHESDKKALEKAGLNSTVRAIIKLYVYSSLRSAGLIVFVDKCCIKELENPQKIIKKFSSFIKLFFTLMTHGLKFPKWLWEYLQKPIYPTHPPLQFRISFLLHHVVSS